MGKPYEIKNGLIIGDIPDNIDPNAIAQFDSDTKGIIIPRISTANRTAINPPPKGFIVFDKDTNTFWYGNGTIWVQVTGGGGGVYTASEGIGLVGNDFQLGINALTANRSIPLGAFTLTMGALAAAAAGVTIGGGSLPASMLLQANSTTKAARPFPEMTEAERLAISTATLSVGAMVYQTDGALAGLFFWSGDSWIAISMAMKEEHFLTGTVNGEVLLFTGVSNGGGAVVGAVLSSLVANSGGSSYARIGRIRCLLPASNNGRAQLYRTSSVGNFANLSGTAWYCEAECTFTPAYSSALDSAVRYFAIFYGLSQWGTSNNEPANCLKIRPPYTDEASQTYKFVVREGGVNVSTVDSSVPFVPDASVKMAYAFNRFKNTMSFFVAGATTYSIHTIANFSVAHPTIAAITSVQSGVNAQRPTSGGTGAHDIICDVYREWIFNIPYNKKIMEI